MLADFIAIWYFRVFLKCQSLAKKFSQRSYQPMRVVEGQGFEPWNRYSRLHAFQACAFDRSAIPPKIFTNKSIPWRIQPFDQFVHPLYASLKL